MDGLAGRIKGILLEGGIPDAMIFRMERHELFGYLRLLEQAAGSTSPVGVVEPHFNVFEEFRDASYAMRYELFCQKLVRERLYDAACFLLSDRVGGLKGKYREPSAELSFQNFAASLTGRMVAYAKLRPGKDRRNSLSER